MPGQCAVPPPFEDPAELAPLIRTLESPRPVEAARTFPRGTLLPDGRLDLCKQALGPEGLGLLAPALSATAHVSSLLLGANRLGPEGARVLGEIVEKSARLRTVYLGCNAIGAEGAAALCAAVAARPGVKGLWLKRNGLGARGAEAVAAMLDAGAEVEALDLVNNELGVEGAAAVARAVARSGKVERLYLCANELGAAGVRAIAPALCVPHLYLSANAIGDEGAEALAEAIAAGQGRALVTLGLGSNAIGPRGFGALAEALAWCPSLERLELGRVPAALLLAQRDNHLGDEGASQLAALIARSPSLRAVDVSNNGITPRGVAQLLPALAASAVSSLAAGPDLPAEVRAALNAALCRNANRAPVPRALQEIKSVYRAGKQAILAPEDLAEPSVAPAPAPNVGAKLPPGASVQAALQLLQGLADDPSTLDALPDVKALILEIGRRQRKQTGRKRQTVPAAPADKALIESTGIRQSRRKRLRWGASERPASPIATAALDRPRSCYICKAPFTELDTFYDSLCPDCSALNRRKREQQRDLAGCVALVTGGRIKIGHRTAVKLLRAGATCVVTTRFPHDAARRYAEEPDFTSWRDRLHLYRLDLRWLLEVERFADHVARTYERLDVVVNNAAQTVSRPLSFYQAILAGELTEPPPCVKALPGAIAPTAVSPLALVEASPLFPAGSDDGHQQPIDLRTTNSWRLDLHQVTPRELAEVHAVNALAPFILLAGVRDLMKRTPGRKYVINASAMEGQFYKPNKTWRHPHTNMAKAALNMLTRTSAEDWARDGILINSVDTGWITNENPHPIAERMAELGFAPPLDEVDGAARLLDPVMTEDPRSGLFFKDYRPTFW